MKKCPKCGNENISITVQYRKSLLFRILKFLCIIAIFVTIIVNMAEIIQYNEFGNAANLADATIQIQVADIVTPDKLPDGYVSSITPTGPILFGLTIALIFCEIIKQWIESKKCIYCVCKECGEIWCIKENIE